MPPPPLTHRETLRIAVPVMLSNVTTPLVGVVDTAVVGRIPDPVYIGAVALGALVFTFLYWGLAFLRMGTTGLTAQADGAGRTDEVTASLGRALVVALVAGSAIVMLQWPIRELAFGLLEGSGRVEALARDYYDVRIWSAPAALANFAILGWFIGLARTDIGLALQLVLSFANMALALLFVLGFGWDVKGVALAAVIAEVVTAALGLAIAARQLRRRGARWPWRTIVHRPALRRVVAINADIMIRTLALLVAYAWFLSVSARQGDTVLAANSILLQFVTVAAYFLDGWAFAAETLVGRAIGAGRRAGLLAATRITTLWAAVVAVALSIGVALAGGVAIDLMTTDPTTRSLARGHLAWAAIGPIVGVWAYQLDGIFIGATRTSDMRNAMLAALAVFFAAWWLLDGLGNHGLWAAATIHLAARGVLLGRCFPRLVRSVPG